MQGGDHGEHPLLLREAQVGLEPHQVIDGAVGVVLAQLHHGIGLPPGAGVLEAPGLQGPVAQGVLSPPGHDLHGHAALKDVPVLEAVDLRLLGVGQLLPEGQVLLLLHGAVDIVRRPLVVPGREKAAVHVHAVEAHQRGRRVEKVQGGILAPQHGEEPVRQSVGGQRPGGHHHLPLRQVRHLAGDHGDQGVTFHPLRHQPGKAVAVHRQSTSGGNGGLVRAADDEAAQLPQLLLQKAHGVFQPRRPQGIRAAQLRKIGGLVGRGHFFRLHLPQGHGNAPLGQLPGALAAGQPCADHCNMVHASSAFFRVVFVVLVVLVVFAVLVVLVVFVVLAVFLAGFFSSWTGSAGVSAAPSAGSSVLAFFT